MRPLLMAKGEQRLSLAEAGSPIDLESLLPGTGAWEVEIGFGKGRFLLAEAAAHPERRFFGIEVASKYFRLVEKRSIRRGLSNLALARGEALFMLSAVVPSGFARAVHVYFPDPWPKERHHKRRLFDPETVDLVLGLLAPQGVLSFATDFTEYGLEVRDLLESHPSVDVESLDHWPEGPRTNYEMKYVREGRQIIRLEARLSPSGSGLLHPMGEQRILSALMETGVS